ncbi:hypothetical protein ENINMM108B2_17050 [Enterobacter intestinihominis]
MNSVENQQICSRFVEPEKLADLRTKREIEVMNGRPWTRELPPPPVLPPYGPLEKISGKLQSFRSEYFREYFDAVAYSLSSGICRYAITTIILQNGDRSVTIMPEQVIRGPEKGCVTMSINVPDSLSGARIFHLSMAPDTGWYIRRGHQSAKENILMTEDCFFQAIDCLA